MLGCSPDVALLVVAVATEGDMQRIQCWEVAAAADAMHSPLSHARPPLLRCSCPAAACTAGTQWSVLRRGSYISGGPLRSYPGGKLAYALSLLPP